VLEEVGEAGSSYDFVAGADVVPDVGGDGGDAGVLVDDEGQTVRERVDGDWDS
jgi:hypothetical protein